MIKGKLWGVGVGPGDSELMTLKAVRLILECDIVVLPDSKKRNVAWEIVRSLLYQYISIKNLLANAKKSGIMRKSLHVSWKS